MTNQEPERQSWSEMGLHLSLATPYEQWRAAPWLCGVIGDGGAPARPRMFHLVEAPYVPLLESAVEQWIADGALPTFSHPTSYLLTLRFSTVGHLLTSFDGFFPPPPVSAVPGLYRQFLLDWWRSHGRIYAVGYSCSEHDADA